MELQNEKYSYRQWLVSDPELCRVLFCWMNNPHFCQFSFWSISFWSKRTRGSTGMNKSKQETECVKKETNSRRDKHFRCEMWPILSSFHPPPTVLWQLFCKINNPKHRLQPHPSPADINRLSTRRARTRSGETRSDTEHFVWVIAFLWEFLALRPSAASLVVHFFNEHVVRTFTRSSALLLEPGRRWGKLTTEPGSCSTGERPPELGRGGGGANMLAAPCWLPPDNKPLWTEVQPHYHNFNRVWQSLFQLFWQSFERESTITWMLVKNIILCVSVFIFFWLWTVNCNCCSILAGSQSCWVSGVTLQRALEGSPVFS